MQNLNRQSYYRQNAQEMDRANLRSLRLFSRINIVISVLDLIAQFLFGTPNLIPSISLLFYSLILYVLVRARVRDDFAHATLLLYLAEIPPILGAVLNGTVLDPTRRVHIFLLYLVLLPVLILDQPLHVFLYQFSGAALTVLLSAALKGDPRLISGDLFNVIRSLLVALALDLIVIRARMSEIDRARRADLAAQRDALTGLLSRGFFYRHAQQYLHGTLTLICLDLTSYNLSCDLFGHDFGDRLLQAFARTLSTHFSRSACCRWSQSRFFVLLPGGMGEEPLQEELRRLLADFSEVEIGGTHLRPMVCAGAVTDTAGNERHLRDLIRLADLRVTQAALAAGHLVTGGFDADLLRAGSIREIMARRQGSAARDELTGMLRTPAFLTLCEGEEGEHLRAEEGACILYFNLLGMKHYNEERGYAAGDQLIRELAALIREHFPDRPAARTGGDHFLVLAGSGAQAAAERLEEAFRKRPYGRELRLAAGLCPLQGSLSIAKAGDRAKIAADLMGGQTSAPRIYDRELDRKLSLQNFLTGGLESAIREHHIVAFFQPIIDARTGELSCCETLSRWIDPERGMISPGDFIPVLEKARLITRLDLAIVSAALDFLRRRKNAGLPLFPLSVNLSRYDLEDEGIVSTIAERTDAAGIDHHLLCIEITESALVENTSRINAIVRDFQSRGFPVWMDDFGSGYSSLNLLQETSFDLIKLDMLFMRGKDPERARVMVREILHMARSLGLQTLVEGVETGEQVQFLQEAGAGRIQGFYYSRPIPENELMDFIDQHAGATPAR